MHLRLASEYYRVESKYPNPMSKEDILGLIRWFKYVIPAGSPSFGIGNPFHLVSLSNCFVIETLDSYGGILFADERIAQIAKRRGGIGLDVSPIRPKGMPTKNAALSTDGILVFMERFSRTCREVAQSGRRGALMLTISVHHPEIMTFIKAKADLQKVTGANISVRISDEFMKAVKAGKKYEVRWPVDAKDPKMSAMMEAKDVWDEIVKHAHANAEPGILFWDSIISNSPADCYADVGFKTESTNPCGELPSSPGDSCRLTSLNLCSYVTDPFTDKASFNDELFGRHVRMAQRMMDDLIDLEIECVEGILKKVKSDPEPDCVKHNEMLLWTDILDRCRRGRRTGLGITAMGDCIAMLGAKYGDDKSVKIVERIYSALRNEAYASSVQLAKERGPFQAFDAKKETDHPYLSRLPDEIKKDMAKHGRRNIACLTTPPAGTISNICGCMDRFGTTSGFEPIFLMQYDRKMKMSSTDKSKPDEVDKMGDRWKKFHIVHPGATCFTHVTGKPAEESPYAGSQAHEIDFMARIKMQAMATKYVDHAISNTFNLPANATQKTVAKLYMEAWEAGCKGVTVYREGSRAGVLTKQENGKDGKICEDCDDANAKFKHLIDAKRPEHIIASSAPKRPKTVECDIVRMTVGKTDWIFLVGKINGMPYETFGGEAKNVVIPKKYKTGWILKDGVADGRTIYDLILGDLENEDEKFVVRNVAKIFSCYQHATFTRLISLLLRHGVGIKWICEQMVKDPEDELFSYNRAMARVLKRYVTDGEESGLECPQCHASKMVYKAGCPSCMVCGHSACA
jgi:ribonucleoside-diphosphate reductase alpha chain